MLPAVVEQGKGLHCASIKVSVMLQVSHQEWRKGVVQGAVQLRGVLTAALQTWSGYTEGELREAAAALWQPLHRSVSNREKKTLPVGLIASDGSVSPACRSLSELLAPLNPLAERETATQVQTGESDVLAGTAAT
jgi:hypothetical protein